jgi:hypothetical protein
MLIHNPRGHYRFLKGIEPYSCGVIADPGYEIVHVTLAEWLPWRLGFERVDAYLKSEGLERPALCAMQLRCPTPFTLEGFLTFNQEYCSTLENWGLLLDGLNPLARTNVSPANNAPEESVLHGFSYVCPGGEKGQPNLIVAGAGELREGRLENERIIRRGETHVEALKAKASYVMDVMEERLQGLGASWDATRRVDVYTIHAVGTLMEDIVVPRLGRTSRHGVNWYPSRPPVVEIEYEMDTRGVGRELFLDLGGG